MGCTHSSSRQTSVHPVAVETRSAIPGSNEQARSHRPDSSLASSSSALPLGSRPAHAPLAISKSWKSSSRIWTSSSLDAERTAFFDTRVSGNAQTWAAIALALSMARDENDLDGAQAILQASGCIVPTGHLTDGIWDETGVLYKLPRWVVSDPLNISPDQSELNSATEVRQDKIKRSDEENNEVTNIRRASFTDDFQRSSAVTMTESKKGKNTIVPTQADESKSSETRVKLRLSDRGTDIILLLDPKVTQIREMISMARMAALIHAGTRMELAFMGRILNFDRVLDDYAWTENSVINCLVFA